MSKTESDFPDTYKPKKLLEPIPPPASGVNYLCFRDTKCGLPRVFAGPFRQLGEALEVVPEDSYRECYIVRHEKDELAVRLYRWRPRKGYWKRLGK